MPPWEFDVMKISQSGLELICKFEGFEAKAYQDAVGVWTIGYGHTAMAGLPDVKRGDKITMKQAQDILATDVRKFELAVKSKLTRAPTQAQFDAMVSLCFNIGPGNFAKSSVLRHFNAGNFDKAAASFALWNKAKGKELRGLTLRRAAEAKVFRAA
jgi:lysozyme